MISTAGYYQPNTLALARVGELAAAATVPWSFRASRQGPRDGLTKALVVAATCPSSPIPQPQSTSKTIPKLP